MTHPGDVRPTSRGPDYPFGVIIHMDPATGQLAYQGWHMGTGIKTHGYYRNRTTAVWVARAIHHNTNRY